MRKDIAGAGPESTTPVFEVLESLVREQAQAFIQQILEEEVTELLGRGKSERIDAVDGVKGYRNGHGKPRKLTMSSGTITIRRPRVSDLDERFESRALPLFVRRTREVRELIPELYLHGLAEGDFDLALRGLLGEDAPLSKPTIRRLTAAWAEEFEAWNRRSLEGREVVYVWADGIYVKAGLERDKAALLVVIGAMSDGTKEVLAVTSGYRESTESWLAVFRDLRARGLGEPRAVVADGNAGIWAAVAQVWPGAEEQRCWNHKILNVLDQLPRRIQPQAREILCKMPYAETQKACELLKAQFNTLFTAAYPNAVQTLERDWDRMITFYRFPKEHWVHLRTSNVVESPFAAVRLRTNAAKRYRNTTNATVLIWKLLMVAQSRFRRLKGHHLLQDVYMGASYVDGIRICHEKESGERMAA